MKKYLITDSSIYSRNRAYFGVRIASSYRVFHPDFLCLRDKENRNYLLIARTFVKLAKRYRSKALLHNHPKLAKKLKADGVHLSEKNHRLIKSARRVGLFVVASCHTTKSAKRAIRQGANMATISPVFYSPNKSEPIGLDFCKEFEGKMLKKIIALGGITKPTHIAQLKEVKIATFASIRYFDTRKNYAI